MIKKLNKPLNTLQANQNKKILVVDDDDGILDAISLILEDAEYKVMTLSNGNDTLKKTKIFEPDIILLDVLLSGSDGREICRSLKDNLATKQIPIIMISAHPTAKIGIKQYGADNFLAKPFEAVDLLQVIEKHLKN